MEQIQSNDACKVETKQENGPDALNETTLRTDWIHGKDRFHICLIPESGGASMFGGLLVDGAKYECDSAQHFVNFNYDADGTFRNVYVQTNLFMNNAISKTESIASLDKELVNTEIQKEYQYAIG